MSSLPKLVIWLARLGSLPLNKVAEGLMNLNLPVEERGVVEIFWFLNLSLLVVEGIRLKLFFVISIGVY
jgi:hypothetical protein